MELTAKELALVSKLIDLKSEYFKATKMRNPIKDSLNDNKEYFDIDSDLGQRDFVELRNKVEDFFDMTDEEREIYQEIRSEIEGFYPGWWRMEDAKEVVHKHIIKALNHYDIDEDTMLKLESKLIDFCIDMGVK